MDALRCATQLVKIGFDVYPSKCEIINMCYPVDEFTKLVRILASGLPGFRRTKLADVEIVCSDILDQ